MIGALERSFWWWIKYTTDGHWRLKLKSGCSLESQQPKKCSTFSGKVRQNSQIVYMWISFCLFSPLRARRRNKTEENDNDGISSQLKQNPAESEVPWPSPASRNSSPCCPTRPTSPRPPRRPRRATTTTRRRKQTEENDNDVKFSSYGQVHPCFRAN